MQIERREFTPAYERARPLAEDQHVGALFAVSAEERAKMMREYVESETFESLINNTLVGTALAQSLHARPAKTLAQLLNKMPVAELRALLRGLGPDGELIAMMKKRTRMTCSTSSKALTRRLTTS